MRISISLDKKKVQADVSEKKGISIFERVAKEILDLEARPVSREEKRHGRYDVNKSTCPVPSPITLSTSDNIFTEKCESHDSNKFDCLKSGSKEEFNSKEIDETAYKEFYAKKRLVIVKCKHCGEIQAIMLPIIDGKATIKCIKCDEEFETDMLYDARYKCQDCGYECCFKTDGTAKEIKCNGCESPIDLKFNKKKKAYYSL